MEKQFEDWFTYNHQANEKFIELLAKENSVTARILKIFSHVLNAHHIWLERISPSGTNLPAPWQDIDQLDFAKINNKLFQKTQRYLLSEKIDMDFDQPIAYANSRGEKFKNTIQEIYFHILAHSAYHRGQIALLLRNEGIEPPLTDYIFYKRDMN